MLSGRRERNEITQGNAFGFAVGDPADFWISHNPCDAVWIVRFDRSERHYQEKEEQEEGHGGRRDSKWLGRFGGQLHRVQSKIQKEETSECRHCLG